MQKQILAGAILGATSALLASLHSTVKGVTVPPVDIAHCRAEVTSLTAKVDDTMMSAKKLLHIEDMLADMEDECEAHHFGVALSTGARIGRKVTAPTGGVITH